MAARSRHDGAQAVGIILVDKPAGVTSHDVVGRARAVLGMRRVGHAGTLDPMATGLLVLGVGRATKLLGHLALERKSYTATIRLGAATTTDDAEGETVAEHDASAVRDAQITAGMTTFTGALDQVPSAVSAVKVEGRRAYEWVRAGEHVELAARPVTVTRFEQRGPVRRQGPWVDVDVVVDCSSGTYVRALARDLGNVLGVGGHLTMLRRHTVGPFGVAGAIDLYGGAIPVRGGPHPPVDDALRGRATAALWDVSDVARQAFDVRMLSDDDAQHLRHGRPIAADGTPGTYAALDAAGELVALVREDDDGPAKPVFVWQAV